MPTYTYGCTECGHRFDLFHSMSDSSEKYCPECGASAERFMGAGAGLASISSGSGLSSIPSPPPRRSPFT